MEGATLFSVGDLFPRTECLDSLMGFDSSLSDSHSQVIKDDGKIQKSLGKILQSMGQSVYVDARRKEGSVLFEYNSTSSEGLPVYHHVADASGDCLTFESEGGSLVSRGIDCTSKKKPLCLKVDAANPEDLTNICETCSGKSKSCKSVPTLSV